MHRICLLTSLVLVVACTSGGPEPQSWELAEAKPTVEAHAGFEHQPERARLPVDPNSAPQFEMITVADDGFDCPYDVEQRGFPAISDDGSTLIHAYPFVPNNADGADAKMEMIWLDAEITRVEFVYDRSDDLRHDDCDVVMARVREKVTALNAELAKHTWRRLEPLDVLYSKPGFTVSIERFGEGVEIDEVLTDLAGTDRPLEVFYQNGHFISRVRGLQVLQDTPRPEWRLVGDETEFCSTDAQIAAIDFDPATRIALVHYNYSTGGCLCDDRSHFGRIELSPELLTEAEQRSNATFLAAHTRALAEQHEG